MALSHQCTHFIPFTYLRLFIDSKLCQKQPRGNYRHFSISQRNARARRSRSSTILSIYERFTS